MVPVTFKIAKTPGGDLHFLGLAIALFGLLAGLIAALLSVSWHPLVWAALSIVVLVWLWRTQPISQQHEYLVLDSQGLRYFHTPGQSGYVSRFSWPEIERVTTYQSETDRGLVLVTSRPELGHAPVMLSISSESEGLAACKLVQGELDRRRVRLCDGA